MISLSKGRVICFAALAAGGSLGAAAAMSTATQGPDVGHDGFAPLTLAPIADEPPARLIVDSPDEGQLARGRVVIRYRTDNLRIIPVYGEAALGVSPRIGHLHLTVDNAPWHWLDASGEPIVLNGFTPGPHEVLFELADPTHKIIDRHVVRFGIPHVAGPAH